MQYQSVRFARFNSKEKDRSGWVLFLDYAKKFLDNSRVTNKPSLINFEAKKRSSLGITTISVTPQLIAQLHEIHQSIPEEITHGVLVWKVMDGTLAQM